MSIEPKNVIYKLRITEDTRPTFEAEFLYRSEKQALRRVARENYGTRFIGKWKLIDPSNAAHGWLLMMSQPDEEKKTIARYWVFPVIVNWCDDEDAGRYAGSGPTADKL